MKSDAIGQVFSYLFAFTLLIGGGYIVYSTYSDPGAKELQLAIMTLIGVTANWVYGKEVQKQTARQQERALLTSPTNGYSVTSSQPITASIDPEPATETNP